MATEDFEDSFTTDFPRYMLKEKDLQEFNKEVKKLATDRLRAVVGDTLSNSPSNFNPYRDKAAHYEWTFPTPHYRGFPKNGDGLLLKPSHLSDPQARKIKEAIERGWAVPRAITDQPRDIRAPSSTPFAPFTPFAPSSPAIIRAGSAYGRLLRQHRTPPKDEDVAATGNNITESDVVAALDRLSECAVKVDNLFSRPIGPDINIIKDSIAAERRHRAILEARIRELENVEESSAKLDIGGQPYIIMVRPAMSGTVVLPAEPVVIPIPVPAPTESVREQDDRPAQREPSERAMSSPPLYLAHASAPASGFQPVNGSGNAIGSGHIPSDQHTVPPRKQGMKRTRPASSASSEALNAYHSDTSSVGPYEEIPAREPQAKKVRHSLPAAPSVPHPLS